MLFRGEDLDDPFGGALAQLLAGAEMEVVFDVFPVALDGLHAQLQRLRDLLRAEP